MTLQQHIDKHYNGSVLNFARANDIKSAKSVYQWLGAKSTYYVRDGELVQVKRAIK
jgi:hypothetical protein